MLRVYIFCIPKLTTGGVELLHQLCSSMNRNPGCEAIMYYWMPNNSHEDPVPDTYKHYGCPYVVNTLLAEEDVENAFFVVPEIRTYLFDEERLFGDYKHRCIFWESVDNYFLTTPAGSMFSFMQDKSILHLSQSEYSRQFLIEMGVSEDMILDVSDYLSPEYLEDERDSKGETKRQDVVLYNPKKGMAFTQKIKDTMRGTEFVPIIDMTPKEVRELMNCSKIYIDFGDHPGRDRIPREAVISGLIVLTGRNGSAANSVDVPVPEECKFERVEDSIPTIADKIRDCLADYDRYSALYNDYRESIRREPAVFEKQVSRAVEVMQEMLLKPVRIYVVGHKDFICPDSEEYIPIYIGEASGKNHTTGSITGIGSYSMEKKSSLYHELTALYTIWKSGGSDEKNCICCLNQYKRFLCTPDGSSLLNGHACNILLGYCDLILPEKTKINASREALFATHYGEKADLTAVHDIIFKKNPDSVKNYEMTLKSSEGHYYNLVVADRKLLDEYCDWLFDILCEFERCSDLSKLSEGVMSHIAEILLDVYIEDRNLKYIEVPLCDSEWK